MRLEQPIFGGRYAPEHEAVVALYIDQGQGPEFQASGTIVHLTDEGGFVLTCRHCVLPTGPKTIVVGEELETPVAVLDVVDVERHPELDMAMLEFRGDASMVTPTLPLSPIMDTVSEGDALTHVGYGLFDGFWIAKRLQHTTAVFGGGLTFLSYGQEDGGPCFGDSGGPALVDVDGEKYVAGIIAIGDGLCASWGNDVRVSPSVDSLIVPFIAERTTLESCEACSEAAILGSGRCGAVMEQCRDFGDCVELRNCMDSCDGEAGCRAACRAASAPLGRETWERLERCVYGDACWASCSGSDSAPVVSACGFEWDAGDYCGSCLQDGCCDAGYACAAESTCRDCAVSFESLQGCAASPSTASSAVTTLMTCVEQQCGRRCSRLLEPDDADMRDETWARDTSSGGDLGDAGDLVPTSTSGDATDCACATVAGRSPTRSPLAPAVWLACLGAALLGRRRPRNRL